MKYCQNCGHEIDEKAIVCVHCGIATKAFGKTKDEKSLGFALLGFFFAMVGLALYLVWKDEFPLKASSCGKGALICVILVGTCTFAFLVINVVAVFFGRIPSLI